jgi:hypothetical protein
MGETHGQRNIAKQTDPEEVELTNNKRLHVSQVVVFCHAGQIQPERREDHKINTFPPSRLTSKFGSVAIE